MAAAIATAASTAVIQLPDAGHIPTWELRTSNAKDEATVNRLPKTTAAGRPTEEMWL